MSILNIKPAERSGSRVVIGISGQSGSGKTLTALKMARGMVDKPEEIGFLDSENGRGRLYSGELDGPFMHADLYAPFSPARYRQAIEEFQEAGVRVLVIDSGSHEWEGEGGCIDREHQGCDGCFQCRPRRIQGAGDAQQAGQAPAVAGWSVRGGCGLLGSLQGALRWKRCRHHRQQRSRLPLSASSGHGHLTGCWCGA